MDTVFVEPKKLQNPCLNSPQRQNLHKELLYNQKIGKNVLMQKTELEKAMEKRVEEKKRKEWEKEKLNRRNSFEKMLENQALKIEQQEKKTNVESDPNEPEFLKIRAKVYSHQSHSATPNEKGNS